MSTYLNQLPPVFPHRILTRDRHTAKGLIDELLKGGTSFAVTMDRPVTIWLSEASLTVLVEANQTSDPRKIGEPNGAG